MLSQTVSLVWGPAEALLNFEKASLASLSIWKYFHPTTRSTYESSEKTDGRTEGRADGMGVFTPEIV